MPDEKIFIRMIALWKMLKNLRTFRATYLFTALESTSTPVTVYGMPPTRYALGASTMLSPVTISRQLTKHCGMRQNGDLFGPI